MKISIPESHRENWKDVMSDKKGQFYKVYFKTPYSISDFSEENLLHTFGRKIISC